MIINLISILKRIFIIIPMLICIFKTTVKDMSEKISLQLGFESRKLGRNLNLPTIRAGY